jgi:RNA polymerase sigma-70 factor (ECF subfamily)
MDAALVRQARRGDAGAFDTLVRRHYRAAYAVALAVLGNRADAEDVCQDSFLKALERLEDCREPEKFAGWLLQVVRNRARNYRDYRRVRRTASLDPEWAASGDNPARAVERAELRAAIMAALGSLSELQREVVLLHDLEGWPHRDVGETLGISEVASRQHLFLARRVLRERLGPHALKEARGG